MTMKDIKNVIFDLGGVLVDLDIERCTAAFRELGMNRVAGLINPCYPAAPEPSGASEWMPWPI